jgi:hypothetical protein
MLGRPDMVKLREDEAVGDEQLSEKGKRWSELH